MSYYNIDPDTLQKAAIEAYGPNTKVSAPGWIQDDCVRVGIMLVDEKGVEGATFGANFMYKTGKFLCAKYLKNS